VDEAPDVESVEYDAGVGEDGPDGEEVDVVEHVDHGEEYGEVS